jgi:tight adherence protein B
MDSTMLAVLIGVLVVGVISAIGISVFLKSRSQYNYEVIETNDEEPKENEDLNKNNNDKTKKKKKEKWTGVLPNYNYYEMSIKEKVGWSLVAMAGVFAVGYIFYQNVVWALAVSVIGLLYPKMKNETIIHDRKVKLLLQFKEALYALSSSLSAGKSVPMAFKDCHSDLKLIFEDGKDNYILDELQYIIRKIDRNETIEDALEDFAERSGLDDVETFAYIFTTCTRTGGNLKEIIRNSSQIICDKIDIKQDIDVIISGKKFDQKVLSIMPIGLVAFLYMSAPDFMEPLKSGQGRIVTTLSLILILIGNLWSKKIMRIEV